ncbi:MAG TPA: sigma 54-interacting transcriptional regulator [Candidatus Angelobacter sp.]
MTTSADRYRTLLDVSGAVAGEPSVEALLCSLRPFLANISALHGADLFLLDDGDKALQLFAFDRAADAPSIPAGIQIACIGPVAQVIEAQQPRFVLDIAQELMNIPELASFVPVVGARSSYWFPVSTSRKKYGILAFTRVQTGEVSPEDLELMASLASHVAVALEIALTRDRAELYQRELAKEHDRLRVLLEVNNHVVTKLDAIELFRAASASIRSYFHNDFTGFWLIGKDSSQLELAVLDFPGSRGFLADVAVHELSSSDQEKLRAHKSDLLSLRDMEKLPAPIAKSLKAESIATVAITPLITASGPLGVIAIGSRLPNSFSQEDLGLLSQISTQIALAVENAIAYGRLTAARDRLEDERLYLESEILSERNFEDIVGNSQALRAVLEQVSIVAPTSSTVLLHGETGTGKELIARAVHNNSPRRDRTFVKVNCAAIPAGLIESELFGHEKGAFTGALMQKKGRFELADHGTLFLDEIGDISLELQPKLLRALQEQEFERLGSARTVHVDVRIIAASHRDIPAMIRNGQFREDLFYRLNVFPIEIPPLRERPSDIPLLVHYFVSRFSRRMQKQIKTIPKRAMETLASAAWPGNIRELENFIERAVILTQGTELNVPLAALGKSTGRNQALGSKFHDIERNTIIEALRAASGRIAGQGGAAERLGLKRTTLQNKMRRLHISKPDYTPGMNS